MQTQPSATFCLQGWRLSPVPGVGEDGTPSQRQACVLCAGTPVRANSSLCICFLIAFSPKSSTCQRDCALIPFPMDSISTETASVCQQSQSDFPKRQNLGRLPSQTPTIKIFKNKQKVGFGWRTHQPQAGTHLSISRGFLLASVPWVLCLSHRDISLTPLCGSSRPISPHLHTVFPVGFPQRPLCCLRVPCHHPWGQRVQNFKHTVNQPRIARNHHAHGRVPVLQPSGGSLRSRVRRVTTWWFQGVVLVRCTVCQWKKTFVIPRNKDLCFPHCHISL